MADRIVNRKANHQKAQDEQIAAGLASLRITLDSLKQDMETRAFLLNLANHNSQYCAYCTPRQVVGECGPTCSLLSPAGPKKGGWSRKQVRSDWGSWAMATIGSYRALCSEMDTFGNELSMEKLFEWQDWVEELRVDGLNQSEVKAERGGGFD